MMDECGLVKGLWRRGLDLIGEGFFGEELLR